MLEKEVEEEKNNSFFSIKEINEKETTDKNLLFINSIFSLYKSILNNGNEVIIEISEVFSFFLYSFKT